LKGKRNVFNIETKKNHTYTANNIVVHNCDTAYTWHFEGESKTAHNFDKPCKKDDFVMKMTAKEVADSIIKSAGKIRRVVFTGGEPMLQQNDIAEVMVLLLQHDPYWLFEFETNGTTLFQESLFEVKDVLAFIRNINCSPKLKSSGNSGIRDNAIAIKSLLDSTAHTTFKFVVAPETQEEDLKEIHEWRKKHHVPRYKIYLMPEGVSADRINKGTKKLFEVCRDTGYKLSTRLQVLLYNNDRAV